MTRNKSISITTDELVGKLITINSFYGHDKKSRDMQFNAIRFVVGDEIYNEAMARLKKVAVID